MTELTTLFTRDRMAIWAIWARVVMVVSVVVNLFVL